MASRKETVTRRINTDLFDEVRRVKHETGKDHTRFIEEALDEKLLREGQTSESLIGAEYPTLSEQS